MNNRSGCVPAGLMLIASTCIAIVFVAVAVYIVRLLNISTPVLVNGILFLVIVFLCNKLIGLKEKK
jgi:hypothetical protein